jgi:hypothetical protein
MSALSDALRAAEAADENSPTFTELVLKNITGDTVIDGVITAAQQMADDDAKFAAWCVKWGSVLKQSIDNMAAELEARDKRRQETANRLISIIKDYNQQNGADPP